MKAKFFAQLAAVFFSAAVLVVPTTAFGQENTSVPVAEPQTNEQEIIPVGASASLVIEDGVVTGYTGTPTDVVIPSGVTTIGNRAFRS